MRARTEYHRRQPPPLFDARLQIKGGLLVCPKCGALARMLFYVNSSPVAVCQKCVSQAIKGTAGQEPTPPEAA